MRQPSGAQEAQFTDLYRQHFQYVYSYLLARTAGNLQLAEELTQETFAAAWLSLDRYRGQSSPRTWLCAIAGNKLKESYRRAIGREKREIPDSDIIIEQPDQNDLEKGQWNHETKMTVSRALQSLRPLYRCALTMKYMDGLRVKEIARVLGRSCKATDGVLQRAKNAFEKAYREQEGGTDPYEG